MPYQLSAKFGIRGGYAIGQDSIFFWYGQELRPGPALKLERVLVDDQGVESATIAYGCSQGLRTNLNLEGCGAVAWPRRSARVGLRFYEVEGSNRLARVGEFWTTNPHRVLAPQWKADPLPGSSASGDLTITLIGFGSGPLPAGAVAGQVEDTNRWPFLRFKVAWKGTPTAAWQVRHCSLADSGGNRLDLWEPSFSHGEEEIVPLRGVFRDGPKRTSLPYTLWAGEAAWKVQVAFCPRAGASFAPEELHAFPNLPVPEPGHVIALDLTNHVTAGSVSLKALHGVGNDPSGAAGQFPGTAVLVSTLNMPGDFSSTVVQVTDQSGQSLRTGVTQTFTSQVASNAWAAFNGTPLELPAAVKSLNVILGVTSNRSAAFLTAPCW